MEKEQNHTTYTLSEEQINRRRELAEAAGKFYTWEEWKRYRQSLKKKIRQQ